MNLVLNAVLFQCVWFACVAGAGAGYWWAGLPALALLAAWQLRVSHCPRAEAALLACAALLGFLIDSALALGGWLSYAAPLPFAGLAPVWIVALWAGFALTVNHSLAFLKHRYALAVLFGALGGPLAYLGAARGFAAVQFEAPLLEALLVLALAWAVATPLLLRLSTQFVAREGVPA
ncbi:MAG: DUF2878 domain-containing protein [Xanthomonadales bacterium]|nr:DUF2878 domain-containing protein [Xanthomonadales bacterium]